MVGKKSQPIASAHGRLFYCKKHVKGLDALVRGMKNITIPKGLHIFFKGIFFLILKFIFNIKIL